MTDNNTHPYLTDNHIDAIQNAEAEHHERKEE